MANRSEIPGSTEHAHDPSRHVAAGVVMRPRNTAADMAHIPGWGADLDLKNRPAVPMERIPPRIGEVTAPEPQKSDTEVFVSPERPAITPVFGTSCPPRGISGMIRRAAYKLTENDIRHWVLLLVADRVDTVEGIVDDLSAGKVPNFLGEMGVRAEFRHNPAGLVQKTLIVSALAGTAYYLLKRRNNR